MATSDKKLHLLVVSQEKQLLDTEVTSITAPGSEGEVTILPSHLPLFTQLQAGVLTYRNDKEEEEIVISRGFLDIAPQNQVTVMVDTATYARDISEAKAEQAIAAAQATMQTASRDQREFIMAEASLKQAMLEMKVAQRSKKARI